MSTKKAFIGYDLGDGETITDFVVMDMDNPTAPSFKDMEMPDSNNPGQAIPTAYAYDKAGNVVFASSILEMDPDSITRIHNNFKRCPSDLMGNMTKEREAELETVFAEGWPSPDLCPEANNDEMFTFKSSVIDFTNAIFTDEKFASKIRSEIIDCSEVVFCIGHPTKWSDLDVAVYKAILSMSVLGKKTFQEKPASIIMEKESRAAYLYVRDKTKSSVLPKGKLALLIDVGSSTIDLTALTSDSRNYQYNSGSKNLGARGIDFLIRDWYLEQLQKDDEQWADYQELKKHNPTMDNAIALCCRKAKEECFSKSAGKSRITYADFDSVRIDTQKINDLVCTKPIAKVLQKWADLSPEIAASMGDITWEGMLRKFLEDRKHEIDAEHIQLGRIILTGSASKMPFVKLIVNDVFSDVIAESILDDMNPSRSISMGLAMVGPSNEKSKGFQLDMEDFLDNQVPQIVEKTLPELAKSLSVIIEDIIINDIVKTEVRHWKNCSHDTLDDMTNAIKKACSKQALNQRLSQNAKYNEAIQHWAVDVVGKEIAFGLHNLCKNKYNVSEFTVSDLNVMDANISLKGFDDLAPMDGLMNAIATVISVIAGIITAVILPTVLLIVVDLIAIISIDLALVILDLLIMMPGIGWTILVGIAGIGVAMAAKNGIGNAKDEIARKIQKVKLPGVARNLLSEDKIDKKLKQENLQKQIYDSILKPESKKEISVAVAEGLRKQIQQRAEEIKYVIESK